MKFPQAFAVFGRNSTFRLLGRTVLLLTVLFLCGISGLRAESITSPSTVSIFFDDAGGGEPPVVSGRVDGSNPVSIFFADAGGSEPPVVSGRVDGNNPVSVFFDDAGGSEPPVVSGRVDGSNPVSVFFDDAGGSEPPVVSGRVDGNNPVSVFFADAGGSEPPVVSGRVDGRTVAVAIEPANVYDPDIVGLWHMDGDWDDYSGSGNHLEGKNGVTFSEEGIAGSGAGRFDGQDDYLRAPSGKSLPLGNSPRTFVAWIKPYSYPDGLYNGIFAYGPMQCGNGSLLSIKSDGRLSMAFWCNDAYQTEGPPAALNEWNHVAFTYDGGTTVKFYMNGQFVQESALAAGTPANTQDGPIRVGSTDDPSRVFDGLIDEVAIYKRALTVEEIRESYNAGISDDSTPPAAPTVNPVDSPTFNNTIVLSGTKDSESSVRINGRQVVPHDSSTTWAASYSLQHLGENTLSVTSRDASGNQSEAVIVSVELLPANQADPGLVGLWHMDGNGLDFSGNGNHLIAKNDAGFSNDSIMGAQSAHLNGGNSYFRTDSGNNLPLENSPRTYVAWIKPFSYPDSTYNGILAYGQMRCTGNGSLLSIKNDGRLSMAFWCNDAYQTEGPPAALNEWNHVAFTYDGGTTVKFYINGQFVQESPLTAGSPANTQDGPIRIGSTDDPGRIFDGLIDEVAIYKRALTSDEIAEQYLQKTTFVSGEKTTKVVYYDPNYPSAWIKGSEPVVYKDFLVGNGLTALNANQLKLFMENNGPGTVVVMAQDAVPSSVANVLSSDAIIRKYLNRGGTVVWMQDIPFYYVSHGIGSWITWGTSGMRNILGVSMGAWDRNDNVSITSDGLKIGLTQTWQSVRPVRTQDVTWALANASGGAAAWLKNYNPQYPNSGFIRIWDTGGDFTSPPYLEDLLKIVGFVQAPFTKPGAPVVNEQNVNEQNLLTKDPIITLTGTKEAGTSIWVNSVEKVTLDEATSWQADVELAYGVNALEIVAKNDGGFGSEAVTLSVTLDNVAPEVTETVPADGFVGTALAGPISFALQDSYSAIDFAATGADAAVRNASGRAVTGEWGISADSKVIFTPTRALADGVYTATIHPTDTLGNTAEASITFTIDATPPAAPEITAPEIQATNTVTLTGSKAGDAVSVAVTPSSGIVGTVTYPSATSWQVNLSGLAEGETTVFAFAQDAAGNRSDFGSGTIVVDTTPPSAPAVTAFDSPTTDGSLTLSGSKEADSVLYLNSQEISGVFVATTWSSLVALGEGPNTFEIFARDTAGNRSDTVTVTVIRDTTAPVIAATSPQVNVVTNAADTISVTLTDSSSDVDLAASLAGAAVKTAVGATVEGAWNLVYGSLIFTPAATLADGTYNVTLHPADTPGNTGTVSFGFTVDSSAPSVTSLVMTPDSPHRAETVTFTLTFSEAMSTTVASVVTLRRDGLLFDTTYTLSGHWENATTWRGSYTFTPETGDGEYTVTVAGARDVAGNLMAEQTVGSFILDTEVPTAPVLDPVTALTNIPTQTLSGTKPADTALLVNGRQKVALDGETAWSISYPLQERSNNLGIVARDAAGNDSESVIASITLDTTPPAFTIDVWQPLSAKATQAISGTREPGSTLRLDGEVIVGPEEQSTNWSHAVTLVEGLATRLTFTSADALGNTVTQTLDLLYDASAPPALAAGALAADGNGPGTQVALSWPSYVEPKDLAYYRIYVGEADFTDLSGLVAIGTADRGVRTFTVTGLTEGTTYFFAVEPVDTSGNSELAVHAVSAVPTDTAAPEDVTDLASVAGYDATEGNTVTLTWTASRNLRGDLADQVLYVDDGQGYDAGTALGAAVTTYIVAGLADATVYKFKLAARDDGGHESAGAIVQAVTRLANPANLTAEPGKNQVTLRWNAVASSHLKHYRVYRLASAAPQDDVAAMTAVRTQTGTAWTDTGLTNGTVYQYAVTAVNTSGAERTQVESAAATPRQDADGPVVGSFSLGERQIVTAPLTVEASAADAESAMDRVEFYLDEVLVATGTGSSVNWYWNVIDATDGNHTVKVIAYDALGNKTEVERTVVVSLAPPSAPQITSHTQDGSPTLVNVSGSAPLYTVVTLKVNGAVVGTAETSAAAGFAFAGLNLVEGENLLTVKAGHRGGDSPYSAAYRITVDTGAPEAPTGLTAKPLAGGSVQFTWQAGTGETPTGYNLYASSSAFAAASDAVVSKVNDSPIRYLFKEIIPADDAERHYAVTALDGAGNESPLSNLVAIASDRSAPTVTSVSFTSDLGPSTLDQTFGPASVAVSFTVSEPLKETPFFSLEPQAGSPIVVSPNPVDALHYSGTFRVDATSPHGPLTWKFSGKDAIGNRGSGQGTGPVLDTRGPAATVTSPAALEQLGATVDVQVAFDEAPDGTPELEFTDAAGITVPVIGLVQCSDALHWSGTVDLSALAEGEATFRLVEAEDGFGNVSTTVAGGQKLLLYKDVPPAPAVPQGLTVEAQTCGKIALLWKVVTGADSYNLYRRAAGEAEFTLLVAQTATAYTDLPEADGTYEYAVASVGLLASESDLSDPASATSDRIAPTAPIGLALALDGAGVAATWSGVQTAGEAAVEIPAGYRLYRFATPITSVSGLAAVAESATLEAVDAAPTSAQRHYAVTALDALGNESAPSASVEIDFPVAPVKNLVLTQVEGGKPALTWEAPQGGLQGYILYRNGQRINATPTPSAGYTDGYYAGGSVTYGIAAVDGDGNESPIREVVLPELAIGLPEGTVLRRGLLETVPVQLSLPSPPAGETTNLLPSPLGGEGQGEGVTISSIRLKVGSSTESTLAGPFAVTAGAPLTVEKVAATPLDAQATVAVVGTAVLQPAPGTTVRITQTSQARVAGSGTALEIFNEPLVRGTTAQVRLKVNNLGSARMELLTSENGGATGQVMVYLKDQDGNVLAEGRLDQRTGSQVVNSSGYASARIEPGQSFLSEPISFKVPQSAPYAVVLEAVIAGTWYHYDRPDQVVAPGLKQSIPATIAEVSYAASAQAEKDLYKQGEPVVITGRATSTADGSPMPYVPVRLGISVNGFDRFYTLTTDESGAFSYTYRPAANEAGSYSLWAVHPDLKGRTVQDGFDILAMTVSPKLFNLKLAKGGYYDIPVTLRNYSGAALTGVQIAAVASDGLTAAVLNGFDRLEGDQSRSATLRVSAAASAPATGYATLTVATDQGLGGRLDVNAGLFDNIPLITASPSYIDTGLVRGTQRVASFTFRNSGLATLNNARLDGPSTPWMTLTVPAELGSLAVGQSASLGVLFRPDAAVPPGIYNDRIVVTADNHIPYTFNLQATVTSDAVGSVVFDVLNELFEDVAGATITLQHQSLPELLYTFRTGADGTVSKFDITEGRYSFSVSATGHKPYSGSFSVQPGLTVTVPVALEVTLVEVEWSVTEVAIEDRYEIKITQTFETNVPTSVLVVDPPGITMPDIRPREVFNGEFTITNQGLVAAKYQGLNFPSSHRDYDIEVLGNIPIVLGPYEKIIVPYRIIRRAQ